MRQNIPGIYTWMIGAGLMGKAKIKLAKWDLIFMWYNRNGFHIN